MTPVAGPLLFARYAYPPNALGLCGADSPRTLLEYGEAGASDGGLAELARTFDGAWPYLELIAGCNGLDDPLDPRVVEAYWVGNALLDRIDPSQLARHVEQRFHGRLGRGRDRVVTSAVAGAVPHHCFHVFAVYPWTGLLRSGVVDEPLRVLDQCRTTPALVEAVEGERLVVRARPLGFERGQLVLGAAQAREVRWQEGSMSFVSPRPGEHVALHWDFVCDVLTPAAAARLAAVTRRVLRAVNGSLVPQAPAAGSAHASLGR